MAKGYYAKAFNQKLREPKFLNVVWPRAKTIAFLSTAVMKFCSNDFNTDIVEKAWVTIPDHLEKAINDKSKTRVDANDVSCLWKQKSR